MKRFFILVLILHSSLFTLHSQTKYDLSQLKMEQLNRGVVAFRASKDSVMVSWRYLREDPIDTEFDIYRNGKKIGHRGAKESTTFMDYNPSQKKAKYEVRS